jgi:hypothetical protein
VDGVPDAGGEAHGTPAFAIFVPMANDVADQLRSVHALGELRLDIVAGLHLDAFEVRDHW